MEYCGLTPRFGDVVFAGSEGMSMSSDDLQSRSEYRRASPLAIIGALGLVALAVAFGVLGPQIRDRGTMVYGVSLDLVLSDGIRAYERDYEKSMFRNRSSRENVPSVEQIDDALARRFGNNVTHLDLEPGGLTPIALEPDVPLKGLDMKGLSVVYEGATTKTSDMSIVMLLYVDDPHPLVTRDEFGMPISMVSGQVYFQVTDTRSGFEVWSATWHDGGVLYVLMASTKEMLDGLVETLGVSDVEEADERAIASSNPSSVGHHGYHRGTLT